MVPVTYRVLSTQSCSIYPIVARVASYHIWTRVASSHIWTRLNGIGTPVLPAWKLSNWRSKRWFAGALKTGRYRATKRERQARSQFIIPDWRLERWHWTGRGQR